MVFRTCDLFHKTMSAAAYAPAEGPARGAFPSTPDASLAMRKMIISAGSDRRSAVRFPLEQPLRYKFPHFPGINGGEGKTVDMSSNGILFTSGEVIPVGRYVELGVNWPVHLGRCALKLVVYGRVVRSEQGMTALEIERYEFRTQGVRPQAGPQPPKA